MQVQGLQLLFLEADKAEGIHRSTPAAAVPERGGLQARQCQSGVGIFLPLASAAGSGRLTLAHSGPWCQGALHTAGLSTEVGHSLHTEAALGCAMSHVALTPGPAMPNAIPASIMQPSWHQSSGVVGRDLGWHCPG